MNAVSVARPPAHVSGHQAAPVDARHVEPPRAGAALYGCECTHSRHLHRSGRCRADACACWTYRSAIHPRQEQRPHRCQPTGRMTEGTSVTTKIPVLDLEDLTLKLGAHSDPDAGMCVLWTGRRDTDGYGRVGTRDRAHRIAWEQANGRPVPAGMVVMHRCDNPPCVNPAHLTIGTVADNNRDRHSKGRSKGLFEAGVDHPATRRRGQDHWQSKLTDEDVRTIRDRVAVGDRQVDIAADYGIHHATVSRISRRIWRKEVA